MQAWPGVLALLSLLAVWWGVPLPAPDSGSRAQVGSTAPALPELRAAPQPLPSIPVLSTPPPEPYRLPLANRQRASGCLVYQHVWWPVELTALGRQQTDGG